MQEQGRLEGLDALRGLAALGVLFFHYSSNFAHRYGHPKPLLLSFPIGHYGVELFFMISGFVILMTLSRTANVGQFAYARFSRLFPVYWAAVAITFAVVTIFHLPNQEVGYWDALLNLTMLQSVLGAPHVDYVYWTLWVELRFYVLMGFIFWLGLQKGLIPILSLLIILNVFEGTFALTESVPGLWRIFYYMPLAKMSYFLIGITLYLAWRDGPNGQTALLLIFCYIASLSGATNVVEHAVVVLILIAMMCFATLSSPKILSLRVLVFFGTISYATYLVHNNIGRVILLEAYEQGLSPLMAIGGATMVSLSIATVLTYGVERPAIRFLRRLRESKYAT